MKRATVSQRSVLARGGALALLLCFSVFLATAASGAPEAGSPTPKERFRAERDALVESLVAVHGLDEAGRGRVRSIVLGSRFLGQGNPALTRHPMSLEECQSRRAAAPQLRAGDRRCGAPHMVLLPLAPARGQGSAPRVCIDQYEFPGIPCAYPVVNVTAREAALLCEALGKRLCDAHEWEGACVGEVNAPEQAYDFGTPRAQSRALRNARRVRVWAYGPTKDHARCATFSQKSPGCTYGWECGSNTYPTGAFPECVSPAGVYDLHGNVAEHMNFPTRPDQLGARGGHGETEMKGSWFIFSRYEAHEDDCLWRAPAWHVSPVMATASHANYHLGFRCCRDIPPEP